VYLRVLQYTGQIKNKNLPMTQVEKMVKSMFEKRKKDEDKVASKGRESKGWEIKIDGITGCCSIYLGGCCSILLLFRGE